MELPLNAWSFGVKSFDTEEPNLFFAWSPSTATVSVRLKDSTSQPTTLVEITAIHIEEMKASFPYFRTGRKVITTHRASQATNTFHPPSYLIIRLITRKHDSNGDTKEHYNPGDEPLP